MFLLGLNASLSVHLYTDRHGHERVYLRRPGEKRVPLAGPLFSYQFWGAYHSAAQRIAEATRPLSQEIVTRPAACRRQSPATMAAQNTSSLPIVRAVIAGAFLSGSERNTE